MPRPDPVLHFVGPAVTGAPARDLMVEDLERIAFRRAFARTAASGLRPPRPSIPEVKAVTADLVVRGRYVPFAKRS